MARERADLLMGAIALVLLFLLVFVVAPVMAAPTPEASMSGSIHETLVVVEP